MTSGTRGIENVEPARCGIGFDGARYAVSAENRRRPGRNVGKLLDEAGALGFQIFDDIAIVHDLMAHVDGRLVLGECPFDDVDCADDTSAKTARLRQNQLHAETPVLPARGRRIERSNFDVSGPLASMRAVPGPASFSLSTLRAKFLDMHRRLRRDLHGSFVTCQKSNTFHLDLLSRLLEEPVTKVRKRPPHLLSRG